MARALPSPRAVALPWAKALALLLLACLAIVPRQTHAEDKAKRRWTLPDFHAVLSVGLEGYRSYPKGRALFSQLRCDQCHRFAGIGTDKGPPLDLPARLSPPENLLAPILESPTHRGLTDGLAQDQVLDLLAFLVSCGDPKSAVFLGSE